MKMTDAQPANGVVTKEKIKGLTRSAMGTVQDSTQSALSTAQDTAQAGLSKTQEALQAGLEAAQVMLQKGQKRAAKNLKKAQKNIKPLAGAAQDSLQSGLTQTQRTLQKSAKKAGESLQQTMQDRRDAIRDRMARAARKRKRNRTLFRVGLVSGLIAALLFTPWPGSETRHQVAEFWRGLFPKQQ